VGQPVKSPHWSSPKTGADLQEKVRRPGIYQATEEFLGPTRSNGFRGILCRSGNSPWRGTRWGFSRARPVFCRKPRRLSRILVWQRVRQGPGCGRPRPSVRHWKRRFATGDGRAHKACEKKNSGDLSRLVSFLESKFGGCYMSGGRSSATVGRFLCSCAASFRQGGGGGGDLELAGLDIPPFACDGSIRQRVRPSRKIQKKRPTFRPRPVFSGSWHPKGPGVSLGRPNCVRLGRPRGLLRPPKNGSATGFCATGHFKLLGNDFPFRGFLQKRGVGGLWADGGGTHRGQRL